MCLLSYYYRSYKIYIDSSQVKKIFEMLHLTGRCNFILKYEINLAY